MEDQRCVVTQSRCTLGQFSPHHVCHNSWQMTTVGRSGMAIRSTDVCVPAQHCRHKLQATGTVGVENSLSRV